MTGTRPQDSWQQGEGKNQLRYVEVIEITPESGATPEELAQPVKVKPLWWNGADYAGYGDGFRIGDEDLREQFTVGDELWVIWRTDSQRWEPFFAGSTPAPPTVRFELSTNKNVGATTAMGWLLGNDNTRIGDPVELLDAEGQWEGRGPYAGPPGDNQPGYRGLTTITKSQDAEEPALLRIVSMESPARFLEILTTGTPGEYGVSKVWGAPHGVRQLPPESIDYALGIDRVVSLRKFALWDDVRRHFVQLRGQRIEIVEIQDSDFAIDATQVVCKVVDEEGSTTDEEITVLDPRQQFYGATGWRALAVELATEEHPDGWEMLDCEQHPEWIVAKLGSDMVSGGVIATIQMSWEGIREVPGDAVLVRDWTFRSNHVKANEEVIARVWHKAADAPVYQVVHIPESGKTKVNDEDVLNYLENQFYDHTGTAYSASLHSLVYITTVDEGTDGTPQLRGYVIDSEISGGGTAYTAGCGLTLTDNAFSVDPAALTALCEDTSLASLNPGDPESCQIKVLIGCGIRRIDTLACGNECEDGGPGSLSVDPAAIAGKGLIEDDDNAGSGCDCAIMLDLGCGLEFDTGGADPNKVRVKVDQDGCISCGSGGVAVNVGDCLECASGELNVKVAAGGCLVCTPSGLGVALVAGAGLSAAGCTFAVNVGNCLEIVSDAVNVKIDAAETCLTCGAGGLKLADNPITDITCSLAIVDGELKLTLTLTKCGTGAPVEKTCTIAVFDCEEA